MYNHLKDELHDIISGKSQVSQGAAIQAVASYLNNGSQSSIEAESSKQIRAQETDGLNGLKNARIGILLNTYDT